MRIYAAGAWHNVLLAGACWALKRCLPWVLLPLFHMPTGAVYVSRYAVPLAWPRRPRVSCVSVLCERGVLKCRHNLLVRLLCQLLRRPRLHYRQLTLCPAP